MKKYTDPQLLLRDLNDSNPDAQSFLYDLLYKEIAHYALRIHSPVFAEELADLAFDKLWEKIRNFNSLEAVRTFLYRTVNLSAKNRSRHIDVVNAHEAEYRASYSDYQEGPLIKMIHAEFLSSVADEVDQLSGLQKSIIRSYFYEDLNTHEISERLSISEQTVRNYKIKALKMLGDAFLRKSIVLPFIFYAIMYLR